MIISVSVNNYKIVNRLIAFEYLEVFQPYLLYLKHYCFKIVDEMLSLRFFMTKKSKDLLSIFLNP